MRGRKLISMILSAVVVAGAAVPAAPLMDVSAAEKADSGAGASDGPAELTLWYDEPASNYNWISGSSTGADDLQPLVIGNGYMGAAFYGELADEKIQLSEKTIWKSGPNSRPDYTGGNKTGGNKLIPELREAAFQYDQETVDEIMDTGLLYGKGVKERGSYQTFGDLNLSFDGQPDKTPEDYRRYLDLENAVGGVAYSVDGVTYTREYLANYPDNVIAVRLTASEAGKLNFTADLEPLVTEKIGSGAETKVNVEKRVDGGDTLTVTANLKSNDMKLASQVRVLNEGAGTVEGTADNGIRVEGAQSVVLLVTIGTDYENNWPEYKGEDPLPEVEKRIEDAAAKGYEQLKEEHIADYEALFGTVDVDLGQFDNNLPTNELLREYQDAFKAGDISDAKYRELEVLTFQFGRYALIASSRSGSLPANLQGVWNDNNNPMWSSDYHLNVNLEMNYWQAMVTNMEDTMLPLIDYVDSLREPGRVTAREYLGIEDGGWVANCSNNPFGYTSPHDAYEYALNPASSAWLCNNIYDYYLFTGDEEMLREKIYPTMREAAEALSKLLVEDPRDGSLVVAPSFSSEHGPVTVGTTYEQTLTYQLFEDVIESSAVVGETDTEFINTLAEQKERLDPIRIGEHGQIKEWREEDIVEIDDLTNAADYGGPHRHTSHLLGLYPLSMITAETPDEFAAAKVSLEERGNDSTGWSRAMKMNEWARLFDGENALDCYSGILAERTISNLFDTHPPLQIDGTLGLSAGVAEMLLQSHAGYVQPIPALPDEWADGSYSGLVARGNFEISASWADDALTEMRALSNNGNELKVRYNNIADSVVTDSEGNEVAFTAEDNNTISFATAAGETYTITPDQAVPSTYEVEAPSVQAPEVFETSAAVYSVPSGFEEIGAAQRELPISRAALEGSDSADVRMYYDHAMGDLSFTAYGLPEKNTQAAVRVVDKADGTGIAQRLVDVEHYSGLKADFSVPADLEGSYELLINIVGSEKYVTRTFTLEKGQDVYDLASLAQEYDRTKGLLARDYTDESWETLQKARGNAFALIESGEEISLREMTEARERMRMAREGLMDRNQTQTVTASDPEVVKEGNWMSSGAKITSETTGDTLSISFYGEGITVIGRSNNDCGKVEATLTGSGGETVDSRTVDLYCYESGSDSCSLYAKKELPLDTYTLTLRHVDGRNYATAQKVVISQFNIAVPSKGNLVTGENLLAGASAEATNYYKDQEAYSADKSVDGDIGTRWATDDNVSPVTISYDMGEEKTFNYLVIKEAANFSNRVASYKVEADINGGWTQIASGGGVGSSLGAELPETTAQRIRITFEMSGSAGVTLSEVELYDSYYDTKETTAQSVADSLEIYDPAEGARKVMTSVVPEGYEAALTGSGAPEIVSEDGSITAPVEDTEVTVTYTVTDLTDGSKADKTAVITVKAERELTAEDAARMLSVLPPSASARTLITSVLPSGFRMEIVETSREDVIDTEGNITVPAEDTDVDVTFRVTDMESGETAERVITVTVPAEEETEDRMLECDDAAVTYSTEIASATTGVKDQWFYSANSSDQGGKTMAYNYQGGDAPWFKVTFQGEKITILSRSKNDQSDIAVTIRDTDGNTVAEGTARCYIDSSAGKYQVHVYESPQLEPGTYTLTGVSQPSRTGEYTVVDGFIISGETGEGADVDRAALNAKIGEAAAYIESGKVDRLSYEYKRQFMDAYNNMLIVRDDSSAPQDQVDQAAEDMGEVITRLTDKTPLAEIYDAAREKLDLLDRGDYEPDAVENVEKAMEKAQEVLDDTDAFLPDIQEAVKELSDALTALDSAKKDWTTLENLVKDGTDHVIPAIEAGGYEAGAAADAYVEAYGKAKKMLDDESARAAATQEEIDKMVSEISSARAELKPVEQPEEQVSKNTLEYFLNEAKGYAEDGTVAGCVESVQKLFEEAIAEGDAVMADESASREEVLNAAAKLMFAIHALEMKAGDKTDLEMAAELGDMIDLTQYVEAGQAEFTEALAKAKEVLADGDAFQDEIDSAWDALVAAMENLRLKADKSVLEDLISQTAELDLSGYTEESVSVFRAAFATANAVLTDEALSVDDQAEVDQAAQALQAAYDGLEKVQAGEPEDPGTDSGNQGGTAGDDGNGGTGSQSGGAASGQNGQNSGAASGQNGQNSPNSQDGNTGSGTEKAAKTGDSAPVAAAGMLLILSAGAGIVLGKRKCGR